MVSYTIKAPIWGTQSVGIAHHRVLGDSFIEIRIAYKDKLGNKVYPFNYNMHMSKVRSYPTQMVNGTELHIVPINDFDII